MTAPGDDVAREGARQLSGAAADAPPGTQTTAPTAARAGTGTGTQASQPPDQAVASEPVRPGERQHLEACIRESLEHYFRDLDGVEPTLMYDMMLSVVEKPLLDVVMRRAGDNQSRAAQWLGINRNTLRRKLVLHKLAE